MKYIDTDKLIALIDAKLEDLGMSGSVWVGRSVLQELKSDIITSLQQEEPSLSSNLDEAANNYGIDIRLGYPRVMDETDKYIYNAFKAGAEWMAGQGETHELTVESPVLGPPMICCLVRADNGDKVVVQIRKK